MKTALAYSRSQIVLHWLIAALVTFQILFHEGIEQLWEARRTGAVPDVPTPTPHTVVGMLILVLMAARIVLRLRHGAPGLPESEPAMLRLLASGTHLAFYVLLIALPVSGAVAWFAGIEQPAIAHGLGGKLLIGLVLLHIAGAIAHQFVFRSDVLSRMTFRHNGGGRSAA